VLLPQVGSLWCVLRADPFARCFRAVKSAAPSTADACKTILQVLLDLLAWSMLNCMRQASMVMWWPIRQTVGHCVVMSSGCKQGLCSGCKQGL
jgi:hypothetical protein